ncbi:YwqG family protein [Anoxybacterium hadale]|uniref:YwqG family protein n=1 Tax=Anoxybacterium hadale TaxID=3408580 RepID=UPI003AFF9920
MNFESLLEPMQKSSIRIAYELNTDKGCPVGSSKIGGKPDLPADFEWFYYKGESYDGIIERRPLSFLAHINCEEANKFDKDNLLPSKGMIYFFYELASTTWGFDPNDKGSSRVYYYPGNISELKSTDFPSDLIEEYKLPEMSIVFSSKNELPDFEEFIEWHNEFGYDKWDAYDEARNKIIPESDEVSINKLLGYANLIQGGMLLSCEETSNGVYTGTTTEIPVDKLQQYKENCTKWQLLFQLESIEAENYEMLWGDVGRIYFYIMAEDLLKLNFDNCWLILQCT